MLLRVEEGGSVGLLGWAETVGWLRVGNKVGKLEA
jgi:hypothetical protein